MLEMVEVDSATGWKCFCEILMKYFMGSFKIYRWNPKWQQTNSWCGVHHAGRAKQRMAWKLLKHILNQIAMQKQHTTHIYNYNYIYIYTHTMCMCRPTYETQQKVETIESRRKVCWTFFSAFHLLLWNAPSLYITTIITISRCVLKIRKPNKHHSFRTKKSNSIQFLVNL